MLHVAVHYHAETASLQDSEAGWLLSIEEVLRF